MAVLNASRCVHGLYEIEMLKAWKGVRSPLDSCKNIIEKSSGSNPRFYADMDFISQ